MEFMIRPHFPFSQWNSLIIMTEKRIYFDISNIEWEILWHYGQVQWTFSNSLAIILIFANENDVPNLSPNERR